MSRSIPLAPARPRLDILCERVIKQLALCLLLNRSRMMWGMKAAELDAALSRLKAYGIIEIAELEIDTVVVEYFYLKRNASMVLTILNNYNATVLEARRDFGPQRQQRPGVVELDVPQVVKFAAD